MKITVTGGPLTLDGEPYLNEKEKNLTFKIIMANALQGTFPDELPPHPPLSGEEKLKRDLLARRVYRADGVVEVTAEEISLIKKLVAKAYATPICAQTWELLEAGAVEEPKKDN